MACHGTCLGMPWHMPTRHAIAPIQPNINLIFMLWVWVGNTRPCQKYNSYPRPYSCEDKTRSFLQVMAHRTRNINATEYFVWNYRNDTNMNNTLPKRYQHITKTSPAHNSNIIQTSPTHYPNITKTSSKHCPNIVLDVRMLLPCDLAGVLGEGEEHNCKVTCLMIVLVCCVRV